MSRILQVVPAYYPAVRYGGPIRSVHGLATALVRRGHDVHVFTTNIDGPQNLDVPLDTAVNLDGVNVHYFGVPALRRLCWSPLMSARLRRTVARFDVVHLHSTFLFPTWAAARAARRAGVPYVLAPRGMLGAAVIRGKSRYAKTAWIDLIERRSLAESAAVHVTATIEADEIAALGLPLPQVLCVPNGIEVPPSHQPLSAGPYADMPQPYALFLSRIDWKKGLDRLITCWKWVRELPLVIAGNDESGYRATLEALAQRELVADRVRFIGPVRDEHKWALYENARLFVLPSYSENFGNVVAEAMAMACPVVVTRDVGLSPLVHDTGAGVVISGEPRELADTINSVSEDTARRETMGRAGKRAALEHLSWNAVAARMEDAYYSLRTDLVPRVA